MKYLLGEATNDESQNVKKWLSENADNQSYFDQIKMIWENSRNLALVSDINVEKAWEKFKTNTGRKAAPVEKVKPKRFSRLAIAASVILLAGFGVAAYFILNSDTTIQLVADAGSTVLTDTLPDGTQITLNKNSTIAYPSKFKGDKRAVTMTGEAFFNVVPDKEKPFIISVDDVEVAVVGTSFNIKSENGETEVLVETGVVKVTRSGNTIELTAGEKIVLSQAENLATKERVTDKLYNYYRSREFVCDDTPLWKLVQVLNEAYDAKIEIGRNELNEMRLNATFNNESLDKVLEVIHLTFDLKVTYKEDGRIILE